MNDYVKREAVKEALLGWDYDPSDDDVEWAIDQIPAADVVEVVRCKDCGYFHKTHIDIGYCDRPCEAPIQRFANSYCSRGVRKGEG